jgi:hypothetical protein
VETAHDVLTALVDRYAFGEVAALVAAGADGGRLSPGQAALAQQLCAFGQRLMDLDTEDFGQPDPDVSRDHRPPAGGAGRTMEALVARAVQCRMPQAPAEQPRGALGSLVPAYRLLLEVIAARWQRRELAALVATVHISSEYLPLLVWESVLGHAGDPARIERAVGGRASRFGEYDEHECPHTGAQKSAAHRIRQVARDGAVGWRNYLDRQHSTVAHALAVCAAECHQVCSVVTRLSSGQANLLAERCRLAGVYADSPIVRLRHAAPVGHGFGVPSPAEVTEAWQRSRHRLGRAAQIDDGFPLPGLPSLFSALAPAPVQPDTLLGETAGALRLALARTPVAAA